MKSKAILLIASLAVSVLVVGCAMGAPTPLPMMVGDQAVERELAPAAAPPAPAAEEYSEGGLVTVDSVSDRMIVREASLSLVVEDTEETLSAIERLASELEGYVSDLRTWRQADELAATVTVRVPAGYFGQARERIKDLALEVESETISGRDVTEEYVDLESRVRNLEVAEGELLELLASAQERHEDAESILQIYSRITDIRQEIELYRGRMRYLEDVSVLATLTINITPEEIEEPVVEPGWDPVRQARDALRSLVNALQALIDVLIWVVLFLLPLALVLGLPLILAGLGWYVIRRRRGRSKSG